LKKVYFVSSLRLYDILEVRETSLIMQKNLTYLNLTLCDDFSSRRTRSFEIFEEDGSLTSEAIDFFRYTGQIADKYDGIVDFLIDGAKLDEFLTPELS
jgi:hypothetical protein